MQLKDSSLFGKRIQTSQPQFTTITATSSSLPFLTTEKQLSDKIVYERPKQVLNRVLVRRADWLNYKLRGSRQSLPTEKPRSSLARLKLALNMHYQVGDIARQVFFLYSTSLSCFIMCMLDAGSAAHRLVTSP
jgi:hypothetical protein